MESTYRLYFLYKWKNFMQNVINKYKKVSKRIFTRANILTTLLLKIR